MNDFSERLANLSREERAQLFQRLRDRKAGAADVLDGPGLAEAPADVAPAGGALAELSREAKALLFERLRERKGQAGGEPVERIPRRPAGSGPAPLSFSQERLWFLDRLRPGSAAYNVFTALTLRGNLSAAALEAALRGVVRRHEALRTTFAERAGHPVQVVSPTSPVSLPVVDLAALPALPGRAQVTRLGLEEALRPFDLERGPLLRATLLRLDAGEHVLVLDMHHIVSDGWSLGLLVAEVTALYEAVLRGAPSPLPELPIQYTDFAVWQRDRLRGERLERLVSYWRSHLAGAPSSLDLPTDRPRPSEQGFRGGDVRFRVGAETLEALQTLSLRHDATLFMSVLAAFQVLLGRYAGKDDVTVGSPVAGRNRAELAPLIGFFVNTLVFRTDLAGDPTFAELLSQVRRTSLAAFVHQDLPFERLVEELRPERQLSQSPLFQVMFTLQNTPAGKVHLSGMTLAPVEIERLSARFDLELNAKELEGELVADLIYSRDLFEATTAHRLVAHLGTLLAAAAAEPGRRLSELPLLTPAESHQLLVDWNATAAEYPREMTVHELFREQAARTPGVVAVIYREEELTYGELAARAGRLARRLRRLGVVSGDRVAICAERSSWLIPGLLGILQAGGAYLPVDPALPAERFAFQLEDGGAALLLGERRVLDALPPEGRPAGLRLLALDDPDDPEPDGPEQAEEGTTADDLAYVLYTSGSTGTPKGVAVTHRNVVRLVRGADYAVLGPEQTFLQLAPVSFDLSTLEIWGPLLNGGRVVLFPGQRASLDELAEALARHRVTSLWLTAGLFHQMVDYRLDGLRPLSQLLAGGDVVSPVHARRLLEGLPGITLIDGYGPTEGTTFTCCHRMIGPEQVGSPVPIGRPIANTRAYVLDGGLRPVPVGVWGELCAGGDGVARGYLGRPALTAERFVPDPFTTEAGGRLYRTGDIVRWRPEGWLEFLGRRDGQVKVRGFRVELGEVEAALAGHPAVRQAAVLAQEEAGGKVLVAYVVPTSPPAPRGTEWQLPSLLDRYLRSRLPEPMVPSAWVPLSSLPLTPNGKIDRRELARSNSARERAGTVTEYVPPRTTLEKHLVEACAQVLRLPRVGLRDNFFALGGHSLLGTQMIALLRDRWGLEVPLRQIFDTPVLGDLADRLAELSMEGLDGEDPFGEDGRGGTGNEAANELGGRFSQLSREEKALLFERIRERKQASLREDRIPRRAPGLDRAPLSFAQERLWFLDRLQPGSAVYNMPQALGLGGEVSPAALEAAVSGVVQRHEALRTTFHESAGQPEQVIAPPSRWVLSLVDLAALPEAHRRAEVRRLADDEARRPFDLERGPLLRGALLRLSEREHVMLLDMHHIVSDGWSMGVLVEEITTLYGAALRGERSPLPELPIQYADFAVWQRGWLRGEVLEKQLAYWRERLADTPAALELPGDRPRPAVQSFHGATHRFELEEGLLPGLLALSREHEATLFMTLFAAYQALLGRWTGQRDILIGSPIANRNRAEIAPLIGFFVNTLVLRSDLQDDPAFSGLLRRVRQTALDAYLHQDLPFEQLVGELRPERHLSHNPLFQTMFALQNAPGGQGDFSGLSLSTVEFESPTAKFDLELIAEQLDDRLAVALTFTRDLFDEPTILRLVGHFQTLLAAVAAEPALRLSELPLLSRPERHQLLAEWNDTQTGEPAGALQRFGTQAVRTPEAEAVVFGDERLTYGELDRKANGLARRLRDMGVGPGVRVGLSVERSPALVVGLLGIWKAGGAYVPMDPAHPKARLSYMQEDAGVQVVVTQEYLLGLGEEPGFGHVPAPQDLAYLIYTSGTTGQPKAVVVEHRQLASTLAAVQEAFGFGPGDRMPCVAPFSFDIFLFELLGPLLAGGTSVLMPLRPTLDVERLVDELERATLLHAVPALMWQVVEVARRRGGVGENLRALFVGGDAVPAELLADLRETFPRAEVWVLYGPTEAAIVCTAWRSDGTRSLLGRPFPGATVTLHDREGREGHLAPVGVPGEIWIGGSGVTRGYWHREELTAEKFVEVDGERFFRSGDLARQLPDGTLEFLGRIDQQVKVRGFRIELGEIEAALARHAEVREAVAAVREDASGSRELVAYVVRRPVEVAPEEVSEHVSQWQALYEETYGRSGATDATFDVQGWNSSYTGEPIPAEEMREWVDRTVERILTLAPRRVLEIGCGTGLLLFRIAPHVERYLGTDFSRVALDGVRRQLDGLPQVELSQRTAEDWSGIESGSFDLVVLNSVTQYFPGAEYLARVLEGAVRAVAPGGKIFVGDVRSLPLLEAMHASVELYRSPEERSVAELRRRVARRVADEEELVLSPGFFQQILGVTGVEVLLKRGAHHNELTRFRYDVVMWVGGEEPPTCPPPLPSIPLPGGEEPLRAVEALLSEVPDGFVLAGLLNARVATEGVAVEMLSQETETVAELRQAISERTAAGVDPEALAQLAEEHGYIVELIADPDSPFHFGAVLSKSRPSPPGRGAAESGGGQVGGSLSLHANDPLRAKLARRLVPELRHFLQAELPEYMVPSTFMLLERLPVTAHGKVDRSALPEPDISHGGQGLAPRTPLEETLAQVWTELLGLDRVGVEDNFFELGGHSLLATQVVSRLRDRLRMELPVRLLFEEPTIAALAARIEGQSGAEVSVITRTRRDQPLPLSFAQERMWFLHELDPRSPAYNIPVPLRLTGDIRPAVLAATLHAVVRRHETLRTAFPAVAGRPHQVIAPETEDLLAEVDLRGLPGAVRERELARLAGLEALRPFDLTHGPLLRATLVRLACSGECEEGALLLTLHHIVSDGWSTGILVRDVGAIYGALLQGTTPALPDLPIQYADFAAWQRRWLQGAALERELAYWRTQLAGEAPALDLPADHPRPAMPSGRGAVRSFQLPPGLAPAVEALGRGEGATAFMTTLAAFLALLDRYTGQDDLWIGSPVANRNRSEIEDLIGFFVNTLVMRTRTAGDPSFRELLGRVRETALGAYAHQDVPFERLVEELRPERDPSRSPLFQVMFAVQNAPGGELHLPGLDVDWLQAEGTGAVQFDLTFFLWPAGDTLVGTLEYSLDLFEAATIDRLAGHFQTLLAGAVGDPAARISDLPLLTEAERRQLLDWSAAEVVPSGETLHGLFAAQARRTPEALALIVGDERLTYADLAARAGRLARRLCARGVGPEVPVAVLMPRSADLVVALLAVLEAGGFYVPIDPNYPEERIAFLLADSGAEVVLREIEGQGPEAPAGEVLPGNLAYLIYTSGSTGRPKAVAIEHRSAVLLARWARDVFGDRELAGVLASTSVTFDLSVFEIFVPLAWGGTVILAADALALPSLPAAGQVTLINTVPSALAELLRTGALPGSLVTVNLAGEALARTLADRIYERSGIERLYNLYGPSEDTTYSTGALVERTSERTPSIGRPVAGTRAWVLDRGLRPAAVGVPGELCLSGGGLARGYHGRPELTAERFVPDPYAGEPGARMYRTGDLARYRADGTLEFLGRLDHQVKIRGFRIELGEVESALAGLDGVREAAVLAREDRLAAYVAPAGLGVEELREALRRRLPEFMVPALWVTLDALPRTATGKLDRRALRAVMPEGVRAAEGFVAPRTPAEERLAAIWAEVLGRQEIGAQDNFFDLGGHSLLATQVVSRLRDQLGVELPLRVLFEEPLLAGLARRVEAEARGVTTASPIVPVPRDQPVPLSLMQERLWFLHQLNPLSPAYNIPSPLWLRGDFRPELLAETLHAVVRRHEALRTTFPVHAGRPYQEIATEPQDRLAQVDLRALSVPAREAELSRLAAEETLRPFDLVRGPVLRALLARTADDEGALLLTVHHIVSDGWSIGILVRDVMEIYGALLRGVPPALPALPVQYADFAQWQRRWAWGEALRQELDWWKGHLAGEIPVLELAADHPRPAMPSGRGGRYELELPAALVPALEGLGRAQGATFFMTTLAAFAVLLARYTGQDDLWIGSPAAGRDRSEVEDLIGFFVNTLVMRARVEGDPAFCELLGRVRESALGAFAHQHVPFEKLVEELRPERDPSRSPLFQVVFGLQNTPGGLLELPGLEVRGLRTDGDIAVQSDLNAFLWTVEERFFGALEYSRDLFEATTVARLAGHLRALLAGVVEDPERPLSAIPLLAEAERQQLLEEWNDTAAALPAADLAALFREQAARRPGAVAVSSEDGDLTYADLAARSGRLAKRLAGLGVGPESVVGLLAGRSPAMIVGMLGILEAGGAYLPLDPDYPAERLAGMLEDARVRLILGQPDLLAALPERARDAVSLTVPLEADPGEVEGPVPAGPFPKGLAYVMFTSGSTGRPKPVGVTHRNVVRLVRESGFADLGPEQVWLQLAPVSFDASTLEIWGALANGGRLALFPPHRPALEEVGEAVARWGVTSLWLTAGLFHPMVDGPIESLRPLRQLLAGGDVLSPPHVRRALEALPGCALINGYGPTEGTTFTTCHTISEPVGATVPIGLPIGNTRVYVLDRDLRPVPIGCAGELYAAGEGLARGYLGRPDLTAERFVPDPLAVGGRLYRTGDQARRRADGRLEFLGRRDGQVKLRGFRVELGEIEAALAGHPEVAAAAVLVRDDRLAAYVVPAGEPDARSLRQFLLERLPDSMVPAEWAFLGALPLSPHGKVDRRALQSIAPEGVRAAEGFVAPRTPAEERLAAIWAEVLNTSSPVGALDDFFELGGHSLLATQVVSRVRESFGVDLPLRALFESPRLADLALEIEAEAGERGVGLPEVRRAVGTLESEAHPLSYSQERLWFLDRLTPGSAAYNIPSPLRIQGPLDPAILERCFAEVIRRHESLRTRFAEREGEPVQVVDPPSRWSLPEIDLAGLPQARRRSEAERWMDEEGGWPFDLTRGPLLRTLLLRIDREELLLLLTLHHIISDGWSIGVLIQELTALYRAFAGGQPSPLPELPLQYAGFSRWQRERLSGPALESHLAYWREQLAGSPPSLDLPLDRPRPAVQTFRGSTVYLDLDAGLASALRALGVSQRASLFMILLAAFKLLLQRMSGQEDVVVGAPVAGRDRRDFESLIGFFLNTLTLRTDLAGRPSFRELVRRERKTVLGAFSHQEVPFEKLLADLQPERDLSRTPLFQVFFNMLNFPWTGAELPGGVTVEALQRADVEAKFDVTVYVTEGGSELQLSFVYNADLFDRVRIEEMARQYRSVLAQAVAVPDIPIDRISLLTPEAAALLPDPAAPLGDEWHGAVHELFAARARRHPERPALIDADGAWTYGELAEATGRLAARLREGGVGHGDRSDRVAIYAHRSAPVVWAVLATLEAGAAFVLLDPAYPAARLAEMIRMAAPCAWLEVAAAGPVPPELEELLPACRLSLPGGGPEGAGALLAELPSVGASVAIGPDDVAYVAFTSGSTGTPKGILGRHGPLSHFLPWQCETFGLGEADRYSMLSGLAHDPLQRDMFTPLSTGGTLCIPTVEEIATPGRLAAWMARQEVTVAHLTPAMGQILTEPGPGGETVQVPTLRYTLLVGDVLTRLDVDRIRRLAPRVTVVNLYGSTETQRAVGFHVVEEGGVDEGRGKQVLPLGRGMRDVQLLVVSGTDAPALAGVGEVGEIWVRSPHLAQGYLEDETLTTERFRINPFTNRPGDRVYRTGDLGRYLPDGQAVFAGRADQQVKIRGFRIELGEIEATLGRLPGVREAVVLARQDSPDPGARRLVAYVVPDPERPADVADIEALRDALRERLPAYMVPAAFVRLDRLPVTPNGKVDRRALPAPEGLEADLGTAYVEPESDLERTIAGVWREVLGLERVGVRHNFFDLGGHSLLLVRLHARLQETLGRELSLVELFNYPNVRALAEHLGRKTAEASTSSAANLEGAKDRAQKQIEAARRQKELAKARRRNG